MKQWKHIFPRVFRFLGMYLEDLLMVAGCICFVAAAALQWGPAGAFVVCGGCLVALAVLVAWSGRR